MHPVGEDASTSVSEDYDVAFKFMGQIENVVLLPVHRGQRQSDRPNRSLG